MAASSEKRRDIGHDVIDFREDLREDARSVVGKVAEGTLKVGGTVDSFEDLIEELLLRVENQLATLTTKAVRAGYYLGAKTAEAHFDKPES